MRNGSCSRHFLCSVPAILLFVGLSVAGPAPVAAQGGSMELTVVDEKGKKVADVEITGTAAGSTEVVATTSTNKKGIAKANFPSAGTFTLTLRKAGFPEQQASVEIREAMNTTFGVTLHDEETLKKQWAVDSYNAGAAKLQGSGQEKQALADFIRATELDPELVEAHHMTALLAAQFDDIPLSQAALEKFLELQPDGLARVAPAAYVVYRKTGRTQELPAVRQALQASGFAGDLAIGVFNEGVKALEEKKDAEAMESFREAVLLDPKLSVGYRSLAAMEFNKGNYAAALPYLEQLMVLTPDHRDGARMAFFSHLELGHADQALAAGKVWVSKDPKASEEISAKAVALFEGNKLAEARNTMNLGLEIDPQSAYGHYTMGRILAGSGDIPGAKRHLAKFLELAPNHPEAEAAKQMLKGL